MDIYISKNGEELGPYSPELLKSKINVGEFARGDYAWHEGLDAWHPLWKVLGLPEILIASAPYRNSDKNISLLAREGAGCIRVIYILAFLVLGAILLGIVLTLTDSHH
jgi:hypothetical protein